MIRILHVIESLGLGGAERRLVNDVTRLNGEFRHTVAQLFRDDTLDEALRQQHVTTVDLGLRRLGDPRGVTRLHRLMREWKPDVLHTQLFGADVYGRVVGWWTRTPVVCTIQSSVYERPEPFHQSPKRKWLDRLTAKRCVTKVIAVSEFVKQSVITDLGVPADRVEVIPNSVEPQPFEQVSVEQARQTRQALGLPADAKVVITVGKLIPPKGHAMGLEAMRMVCARLPGACWLIVGDGPSRDATEQLANEMGLGKHVRFLGVRRDIPELLAASDVFLFPSTSAEGLPVALLEAMAAGKPCVGFRIGPVPEVIEEGRSGHVVEPRSAAALAEAVQGLLGHPARCRAMGEVGRQRVREHFHADRAAERLGALYRSLVRAA